MSASAAVAIRTRAAVVGSPPEDRRWHPAVRAVTIVTLGALAWAPVIAAGWLIFS